MKKVLLYGGSFDPPHRAHVDIPNEAMKHIGFDEVLYVPAYQSPLKDHVLTPAKHRLAMLEIALRDEPWATISTIELDRKGTSFTIDTIESLQNEDTQLRLLIGADQWEQFPSWKKYEDIITLADPVIMPRVGFSNDDPRVVPIEELPTSSSSIRQLIGRGEPINPYVTTEVASYIAEHNLYE